MYIFDVAARAEADILLPDYDRQKGWFGGEPEKQPGVSNLAIEGRRLEPETGFCCKQKAAQKFYHYIFMLSHYRKSVVRMPSMSSKTRFSPAIAQMKG